MRQLFKVENSTTQSKKVELTHIFRQYLTTFIIAVPGQWSESRDLVWSRDTGRELYTGGISRPSSRFSDGLRCLILIASLTLRLIFESSDVKILDKRQLILMATNYRLLISRCLFVSLL